MRNSGFSLIELVVAIAIFTVLSLGVVALVSNIFTGSNQQAALLANSDQARQAAARLTNELRNATTAATGAYAIDTAADQQLIFYSNADTDQATERIRYYIQGGKLYRGVVEPTGSPAAYNTASEASAVVQNDIGNGSTPLFYYYNDTYDGTSSHNTPLSQPVNVTAVRFIKFNLMIFNKAGVKNTNTYTITAGAAIRNLKTNLGN
jgi:prepilin-type N-terminal cleavage/methylation domain-containing protein